MGYRYTLSAALALLLLLPSLLMALKRIDPVPRVPPSALAKSRMRVLRRRAMAELVERQKAIRVYRVPVRSTVASVHAAP